MSSDRLNLEFYSGSDLYSDGDIEDELLNICKQGNIEAVLRESKEWPILYHLSSIRENILDWYQFQPGSSVLEIGSGCGAITGLLCRKAEKVVAIELSKRRSLINLEKNKTCDNLEIYVGNFEDIKIKEKFDYVTLIGVLEYAKGYIPSEKPFEDMLNKVKGYLKPNGKIIIAIENKFGLKYWTGAMEDHTGQLFDGINDYRGVKHVRTFTKPEIVSILNQVGLVKQDFYYPMPDYKLPKVIYSDSYLPSVGEIRNVSIPYDRERYQLFSEEIVYDNLCKDKKFSYFANSFLIIASE